MQDYQISPSSSVVDTQNFLIVPHFTSSTINYQCTGRIVDGPVDICLTWTCKTPPPLSTQLSQAAVKPREKRVYSFYLPQALPLAVCTCCRL